MARAPFDVTKGVVFVLCLGLGAWLWPTPYLLPLKLLVVLMHETGHALATLAVGGRVDRVTIASNEAGACLSALPGAGWRAIAVYSAGYVGSALAGAALLLATFRWGFRRRVLVVLASWVVAMGVLYAGDVFTLGFCVLTALALGASARWLPLGAIAGVNTFVASFASLYAVLDLRDDLWVDATRARSDAALLAHLTGLPAILWAGMWTLLSVAIVAWGSLQALAGTKRGAHRPKRRA